ncbi:MAG TPA: VanZ family protein [Candidatus Binataceae bacterium]|jgi:VanZ family protein|nr:VanZ family protein [Candidatus Binataceae bacterium]
MSAGSEDRSSTVAADGAGATLNHQPSASQLRAWLPVLIWISLLFVLSTSVFSSANTSLIIVPLLHWLLPFASPSTIALLHGLTRKCAHFVNYGILFWLLIRGPMAGRPYSAFALCVAYALLDEGHQIFVPGRTPSLYDVALDSSGALFSRFLAAAMAYPLDPVA